MSPRLTGQHTAQRGRDPLEIAGQDLAEITEQVKAIGDLGAPRGPCCRASGIILGPVTGNDFDPGMVAQPCGDGLGRALRQEIDRPMLFEIHQDRAIDPALAEGKIIDAQDPGRGLGGRRRCGGESAGPYRH